MSNMFKGLKAKIEEEQKGKGESRIGKNQSQAQNLLDRSSTCREPGSPQPSQALDESLSRICNSLNSPLRTRVESSSKQTPEQSIKSTNDVRVIGLPLATETTPPLSCDQIRLSRGRENGLGTIIDLETQIKDSKDQLEAVIKERDELKDRNEQLLELVEKLRNNLKTEEKDSSSLKTRLHEAEASLKQKEESIEKLTKKTNLDFKCLRPNSSYDNDMSLESEDIETLRARIVQLKNLVSEKSRQLKISQQNLNDIKKALQTEIVEHGRTRKELQKLQQQPSGSQI